MQRPSGRRDGADGPDPLAPVPGSFPIGEEEKHKKETFSVLWI